MSRTKYHLSDPREKLGKVWPNVNWSEIWYSFMSWDAAYRLLKTSKLKSFFPGIRQTHRHLLETVFFKTKNTAIKITIEKIISNSIFKINKTSFYDLRNFPASFKTGLCISFSQDFDVVAEHRSSKSRGISQLCISERTRGNSAKKWKQKCAFFLNKEKHTKVCCPLPLLELFTSGSCHFLEPIERD